MRIVMHTLTLPSIFIAQIIGSPLILGGIYIELIFKCAKKIAQYMNCLAAENGSPLPKRKFYWD